MHNYRPQRSKLRVATNAFLSVCICAAGLVVVSTTVSAHHTTVDNTPRVGTYTDRAPDRANASNWTKREHNCGFFGCGGDFWVTTEKGARAEWFLPNIQGVYTFGRNLGKHFRIGNTNGHVATGTIEWSIWEWRRGSKSYKKVKTFNPPAQTDRLGWWNYNRTRIELDGAVKIIAKVKENGKLVGVQNVRLTHVDVLPEHLELAKDMCVDGDENLRSLINKIVTITGLAASVVATFILPGIGHAVLAAQISAAGVGLAASQLAADAILDYLLERDTVKVSYCGVFHARLFWQGYSKFSDDIAELSNAWGIYKTVGCTYAPTRRTPTSSGNGLCETTNT